MHLFLKPIMEELVHLGETGKELYLVMTYDSMSLCYIQVFLLTHHMGLRSVKQD